MQSLANQADVAEYELVRFIIDGLDDNTPAVALLYPARNLATLKDLLNDYERFRSRTLNRPMAQRPAETQRQPTVNNNQKMTTNESLRCYNNCREFGHMSPSCTRPRRPPGGCFKCFEVGHQYKICPQRMVNAVAGQAEPVNDVNAEEELVRELSVMQMVSVSFLCVDGGANKWCELNTSFPF